MSRASALASGTRLRRPAALPRSAWSSPGCSKKTLVLSLNSPNAMRDPPAPHFGPQCTRESSSECALWRSNAAPPGHKVLQNEQSYKEKHEKVSMLNTYPLLPSSRQDSYRSSSLTAITSMRVLGPIPHWSPARRWCMDLHQTGLRLAWRANLSSRSAIDRAELSQPLQSQDHVTIHDYWDWGAAVHRRTGRGK